MQRTGTTTTDEREGIGRGRATNDRAPYTSSPPALARPYHLARLTGALSLLPVPSRGKAWRSTALTLLHLPPRVFCSWINLAPSSERSLLAPSPLHYHTARFVTVSHKKIVKDYVICRRMRIESLYARKAPPFLVWGELYFPFVWVCAKLLNTIEALKHQN